VDGPPFEGLDDHFYQTTTTLWFYQGGKWHDMQWMFVVRGAQWWVWSYTTA